MTLLCKIFEHQKNDKIASHAWLSLLYTLTKLSLTAMDCQYNNTSAKKRTFTLIINFSRDRAKDCSLINLLCLCFLTRYQHDLQTTDWLPFAPQQAEAHCSIISNGLTSLNQIIQQPKLKVQISVQSSLVC